MASKLIIEKSFQLINISGIIFTYFNQLRST